MNASVITTLAKLSPDQRSRNRLEKVFTNIDLTEIINDFATDQNIREHFSRLAHSYGVEIRVDNVRIDTNANTVHADLYYTPPRSVEYVNINITIDEQTGSMQTDLTATAPIETEQLETSPTIWKMPSMN